MSGIGVMVQPLPGWEQWLAGLIQCPEEIVLDVRGRSAEDVCLEASPDLTVLLDQKDWHQWFPLFANSGHRPAVVVHSAASWSAEAMPCVTSVKVLQEISNECVTPSDLMLLPGDLSGWSGSSSSFVLLQEALQLFPETRLICLSASGPHVVAALLQQGVDTVLLGDQLLLLSDHPLPTVRKRRLARLQRGHVRAYHSRSEGCLLQVAPLNPQDWKPSDPAGLERYSLANAAEIACHGDERLAPMGEGVLLSRAWSEAGWSCSDLLAAYHRHLCGTSKSQGMSSRGRAAMSSWLGTPLPVVQGPMTRVSDGAAFARAVADAGAMPVIAAAMLPAKRLREILDETADRCRSLPWGVGVLAFRPQADLQPQIEQILEVSPDFVVLAGGDPSQIAQFGDLADRVCLHSPTPELFERQLNDGCRNFILEGRECGGHTGPCSSLSLWESCLDVLSQQPLQVQEQTRILFAGGIQGPGSTLLIAQLLEQFGLSQLSHGLLVGTLSLFSHEAVGTGAISEAFQQVLLESVDTVLLETAPGHQSRCAFTPFADEFLEQREQGLAQGLTGSELSSLLDRLILGRLRLASKGLRRDGDQLVTVSREEQYQQGMFMVGEVAALQKNVAPLRELFEQLLPPEMDGQHESLPPSGRAIPEPVAITGMAVAFPGATSLTAYWSLILRQESQIRVVPEERWPSMSYYSADGGATSVVSKWGTFLDPVVIDLAPYPLTPAQAAVTEPTQILALDLVAQALDAAASNGLRTLEREQTAVVFAASGGLGELGQAYTVQTALASDPDRFGPWLNHLPDWTNSSFPGLLSNVTAGRVSNAFDLSGTNLLVDAACASALAAVDVGIAKLRSGECDRVIVGSVDNLQGPFPYFCFSQSGALSRQGQSRPFCTDSDGIVIGEGCAVIVLQRLETAQQSGADVYAVIDAIGSSSDGKGRSLTAPSHRGQILAFERAFAASDRHPAELRYYEAHGTGTPVGDRSEIAALTGFLQSCGVDHQRCAVGSVKALIGHTKASAGLAGLIKAALALHHGTLPGQEPVRQPHQELAGDGPVYIPSTAAIWPDAAGERLAAVSAFGFGGTNFTVLLSDRHRRLVKGIPSAVPLSPLPSPLEVIALPLLGRDPMLALQQHRVRCQQWLKQMVGVPRPSNAKLLEAPWLPRYSPSWARTGFLALDRRREDVFVQLEELEKRLAGQSSDGLVHLSSLEDRLESSPPVVLLFPGQGSVYPGMGSLWMLSSPRVRRAMELLQTLHPDPEGLTRVLGGSRIRSDQQSFWTPSVMQVVLMLHQLAAFDWLDELGLRPDAVLGHSIGDYLALHAAGVLSLDGLVQLVVERAVCLERCIAELGSENAGGMLVVKEPLAACGKRLAEFDQLILANRNAPNQGVVAGPIHQLDELQVRLEREGVEVMRLDLPVAYHHPCLKSAAQEFSCSLDQVNLQPPKDGQVVRLSTDPSCPLRDPEQIRAALRVHLCGQVDFVTAVKEVGAALPDALYIDVGPRQTGGRLLQANGVAEDQVLRMDDRKDPASQPLRVGFALLKHGVPLDEGALMRLSAPPRQRVWSDSVRGRLPYLVNGHAAIPMDGSPMPESPLVPVTSPSLDSGRDVVMPDSTADRLLEVYAEYQQTMRKFLDSQDQVFTALAGGPMPSSAAQKSAPAPSSTPIRRKEQVPPEPHDFVASELVTKAEMPLPLIPSPKEGISASAALNGHASPFSNEQSMQEFITGVLADRTGYPPELLELDAHLESDLGIDSIKQVEVLGALLEAMPAAPNSDQMPDIRAAAREKQTIQQLSSFMLSLHAGKV